MTFDPKYYQGLKQKQVEKWQKQQQKWIQMSELAGKEYISLLETQQEVQAKLKEIEAEEAQSKQKDTPKEVPQPAK